MPGHAPWVVVIVLAVIAVTGNTRPTSPLVTITRSPADSPVPSVIANVVVALVTAARVEVSAPLMPWITVSLSGPSSWFSTERPITSLQPPASRRSPVTTPVDAARAAFAIRSIEPRALRSIASAERWVR